MPLSLTRVLDRQELDWLLGRAGPCVSLFTPLARGPDVRQNRIRLRRLLRTAGDLLVVGGLRPDEARDLLASGPGLLEEAGRWQHRADGLAVFAARDGTRWYHLPLAVAESVGVGERFELAPLLPLLHQGGRFYVLALSQHAVRLLHCGPDGGVVELATPGVPASLAEAMRFDDREDPLQLHASGRSWAAGHRGAAMFHGHGIGADDAKDRLHRFLQQVDAGLHPLLAREHVPLVLAAVDYLVPLYREVSTYPHLAEGAVGGNPDRARSDVLRDRAWALLAPERERERRSAVGLYQKLRGTRATVTDPKDAVEAARRGGVALLLLSPAAADEADDLVELTVAHTLLHGGLVYGTEPGELGGDELLAAVLHD